MTWSQKSKNSLTWGASDTNKTGSFTCLIGTEELNHTLRDSRKQKKSLIWWWLLRSECTIKLLNVSFPLLCDWITYYASSLWFWWVIKENNTCKFEVRRKCLYLIHCLSCTKIRYQLQSIMTNIDIMGHSSFSRTYDELKNASSLN